MATIIWIASKTSQGLLWTDPSNWVGGVVPGVSDTALFNAGSQFAYETATIDPGTSVQVGNVTASPGSYAEIDLGGTLDASGTLSLAAETGVGGAGTIDGGTLDISSGIHVASTLDGVTIIGTAPANYFLDGTFVGGLTVLSPLLLTTVALLTFDGTQTFSADVVGPLNAVFTGTLTIAPGTTIESCTFRSTTGTLVNDGTIIDSSYDGDSSATNGNAFQCGLVNDGVIDAVESDYNLYMVLDNAGTINAGGVGLEVDARVNTGVLHVVDGVTLSLSGYYSSGSLTNAGGLISIDAGGIVNVGEIVTGGTVVSTGGTLTTGGGSNATLTEGTIDGVTLEGSFADLEGSATPTTGFASQTPGVRASATIASGFAFVASAAVDDVNLSLADTSYSNNLDLSSTADLTLGQSSNVGFFFGPNESSTGYTYDRAGIGAGGSLILGGTIDAFAGQVYVGGGTGGIVNTGTILTAAGETLTFGPADQANDSTTAFANDGLFQIAAGSDIVIDATVSATGFSGLTQNGATLTLGLSGTIDGSAAPGSTVTLTTGSIIQDDGLLRDVTVIDNTSLTVGGTLDGVTWVGMPLDVSNQAMTVVRNGLTVTGTAGAPGSIVVGGTNTILNLQADTTLDNVNITVGSTLADQNSDTISLIDGTNATGTGDSNLTIGSSATLTIGGSDTFDGTQNLGTLSILGTLQIAQSSSMTDAFPEDSSSSDSSAQADVATVGSDSDVIAGEIIAGLAPLAGVNPAVGAISNATTIDGHWTEFGFVVTTALRTIGVLVGRATGQSARVGTPTGENAVASASSPPSDITASYLNSIESHMSGSGTVEVANGGAFVIDATIASTLNLAFASSGGYFAITDPANTNGHFENFGAGDGIDLAILGYAGGTVTYSNGQLVIPTANGSFALNVAFASGYSAADVELADDTEGGTFAYIPSTMSATVPGSGSLPNVSGWFTAPVLTSLQSVLTALTPTGATANVASVTGAGSAGSPVSGTLNAAVYSSVAGGATIDLPTGFAVGYLLSGAASLQDTTGGASLIATAANDSLVGAANDTLFGGNSGETLFATTGAETLIGGTGNNAFFLGASDALVTSQGNDIITGSSAAETINASGSVLYFGTSGATTFNASTGSDTIIGGNTGNTVTGGGGGQLIFGSSSLNYIGGAGAATIIGGGGGNTITGGSGNELIFASSSLTYTGTGGAATIIGGGGPMNVNLGSGGGVVYGSPNGSDTIASGSGTAILVGGGQGDLLTASGSANDTMVAGGGAETLSGAGSTGNLVLFGGPGSDSLVGGAGGNLFIAESGNETLVGGGSSDSYVFIATPGTTRTDVIVGFNPNVDAIGLFGYGAEPGADQAALASATISGGNTLVSLTDGTTIVFTGAPTLHAYNFF